MSRAFIGLGSNIGDRQYYLKKGVALIGEYVGEIVAMSSVEETLPVDFIEQPCFLNQIIIIETDLAPAELLSSLKSIEEQLGRIKRFPKGPREIDLDILLYDSIIYKDDLLEIPHREIKNRDFIIKHLVELDPSLIDPVTGVKYIDIEKKRHC